MGVSAMKSKMKRKELMTKTDIVNAVMMVLSEAHLSPEENPLIQAVIVYHYYSEMESGGHESLFRWYGREINELGIDNYLNKLSGILEEIGAHDYARIEKQYCKKLWSLYNALENDEIEEDAFYGINEKATAEYYNMNDTLRGLLESYFVVIYTDLIDVIEE